MFDKFKVDIKKDRVIFTFSEDKNHQPYLVYKYADNSLYLGIKSNSHDDNSFIAEYLLVGNNNLMEGRNITIEDVVHPLEYIRNKLNSAAVIPTFNVTDYFSHSISGFMYDLSVDYSSFMNRETERFLPIYFNFSIYNFDEDDVLKYNKRDAVMATISSCHTVDQNEPKLLPTFDYVTRSLAKKFTDFIDKIYECYQTNKKLEESEFSFIDDETDTTYTIPTKTFKKMIKSFSAHHGAYAI